MFGAVSNMFGRMVLHGELTACIERLEEAMSTLRKTPYHEVLGRNFLHQTDAAANYLIDFHRTASSKISVAAIYFEMNGFTINPDQWYFDGFAYEKAGEIWDLDWLAYWGADTNNEQFTLTGMESVQEVFAKCYCDEDQPLSNEMTGELAAHLVNARFMQLIASAHAAAKLQYRTLDGVPVLATAHDWDQVHRTE